jgi:hypothetical protein
MPHGGGKKKRIDTIAAASSCLLDDLNFFPLDQVPPAFPNRPLRGITDVFEAESKAQAEKMARRMCGVGSSKAP